MAAQERITDPVDLRILEILQSNARETQADIARAVGLAPSAVLERIRKLDQTIGSFLAAQGADGTGDGDRAAAEHE